jgi:hypothetical protein
MGIFQQFRYQRHWLIVGSAVHHCDVKLNSRVSDSLILATFNLCVALSGFLVLHTSYSAWIIAVCWVLLPPLLVVTLFFWGRDLVKAGTRKQAIAALLVSIPVLALEVWFFKNLNL